jgi:hypothetical protein
MMIFAGTVQRTMREQRAGGKPRGNICAITMCGKIYIVRRARV